MNANEMSYNDLAGEVGTSLWIVNVAENSEGIQRIQLQALSEQDACMQVEDRYGVTAISAYLA